MEEIIAYFEHIPTYVRSGLLVGGIVILWILEGMLPFYNFPYHKIKHAALNLFFTACTLLLGLLAAGLILFASDFTNANNYGLLNIITLPLWLKTILGVLLLDLIGAYFIHWLEHQVKFMWKFHITHHTDTAVDVTTGLRHHPGEAIFRLFFTILAVFITGASMGIVMLYQTLSVFFAHLTHANLNTQSKLSNILSYIFVTPDMHKVHHHYTQPLTDTNYGNIFSIWDRLFGTFAKVENSKDIVYGLDTHMEGDESNDMKTLLKIPFQEYRPPVGTKFGE